MAFRWTPQGQDEGNRFSSLEPVEVLDWFDGPRIFTFHDGGIDYLAYSSEETDTEHRYLIVPTDSRRVEELKRGALTIYEALESSIVWVVDTDHRSTALKATLIPWRQVPGDVVPEKDVLLSPDLEPLLRVYVKGDLGSDEVTASILKKYVDGASLLMQKLSQAVEDRGVPVVKGMFDPPVQRVAFGSLIISYSAPSEEILQKTNLPAIVSAFRHDAETGDVDSDARLVDAIVKICPFQSGPVDSVTLSGLLTGEAPIVFRRGDRTIWREKLQLIRESKPVDTVEVEGRIGELDWDKGTFILRDVMDSPDQPCRTDEPIISELREIFSAGDSRIKILGKRLRGNSTIDVERYEQLSRRPDLLG